MNNIRKLKKKHKTKILNPQQMAQQKLFEISNQEDAFHEPEMEIEKITRSKELTQNRGHTVQGRRNRFLTNTSYEGMYESSTQLNKKKPLTLINYILIDHRENLNKSRQARERSFQQICLNNIKRRMMPRTKSKTVRSTSLKNTQATTTLAMFKIKNMTLYSKYPSYFNS